MSNRIRKIWLSGTAAVAVSAAVFGMVMIPTGSVHAQTWARDSYYNYLHYRHNHYYTHPYYHPHAYNWKYYHPGPYSGQYYPYLAFGGYHYHNH